MSLEKIIETIRDLGNATCISLAYFNILGYTSSMIYFSSKKLSGETKKRVAKRILAQYERVNPLTLLTSGVEIAARQYLERAKADNKNEKSI